LLAGSDCVALDTLMAKIMGITKIEVLTTKEAALRNLGEAVLSRIEVKGEDIDKLNIPPFLLPKNYSKLSNLPLVLKKIFKSLVRYYPYSLRLKCTRCGHCVKVCPQQCIRLKKSGIQVDYHKCIACFCCQEACPEAAIGVKKSLLARLIGL
jgi:ferredoxin